MNQVCMMTSLPLGADPLLVRIKAEFIEMPGLRVTPWQAQRLWGLEPGPCDEALTALVGAAFLRRTPNGSYVRADN